MIFDDLIDFDDALQSRKVKALLPNLLSSAELQSIRASIKERAVFSAKTANADYLQKIDDVIQDILKPRIAADGHMEGLLSGGGRQKLKETLDAMSYKPEKGKEGTIQDLSSDARLNLVVDTNQRMSYGYGYWKKGMEVVEDFPAYELFRAEERNEPRDWEARWDDAGGERYDGRMIALKTDAIWTRISAFGLPYPPFDYNSGMNVMDVDRAECIQIGLIDENDIMLSDDAGFNDDMQVNKSELAPELKSQLLKDLKDDGIRARFDAKGVLRKS